MDCAVTVLDRVDPAHRAASSTGAASLTRRLSRSQQRIHPACGARPGRARAPAHARPACRTGTRNASPARGRPPRRGLSVPHGEMLGKPGEQHVPALITGRAWRIFEQPQASPSWLLVVLLQELDDQPPLRVEVRLCRVKRAKERVFAERPLPPVQAQHCCFALRDLCCAVASSRRSADAGHRARRPAGPCRPPGHGRPASTARTAPWSGEPGQAQQGVRAVLHH